MPGEDGGSEGQPNILPIAVPVAVGTSVAVVLTLLSLIVFARRKKQKTRTVSKQQQVLTAPGNEEQFEMAKNDAYTAVIATERNQAYVTNTDSIPAARNAAYGVIQLEGGNTLNREDTTDGVYVINQPVYDEPQGRRVQTVQGGTDAYDYV